MESPFKTNGTPPASAKPRMANLSSLRLRMIAAFLLVAVPPMLFSAYFAARVLSDAFDRNVQQWLGETANYISEEVEELMMNASHSAKVIGEKISHSGKSIRDVDLSPDVALLSALGVDVVAVYGESNELLYSSIPIEQLKPIPTEDTRSLFDVITAGKPQLAAGAIYVFQMDGRSRRVFVGYWLSDTFVAAARAITSLEFEIFRFDGTQFVPALPKKQDKLSIPPSADIINELSSKKTPVYGLADNQSIYRSVYSALRASSGELLGVVFVGATKRESLFDQIGRWHLFLLIFLLGSTLSVLAGLYMSGLLVRPLRALTDGVRSVSKGDFKQRVPVVGGTEVEELAASFNTMASELERLRMIESELRAKETLSALGEAAAVIAHEIRNPLGIIKTSSELVRTRATLTAEESRVLGYVTEEVNRIERLIHNFLDFAKPTPPALAPVRLSEIVARIGQIVGPEFEQRKIIFRVHDESVSSEVLGDADQIYQVCLNLVLNSMDALNGSGTIDASIRKTGGGLILGITDNGSGIPDDVAPHIFDPFFTTKASGTGLGLAKAQSVMSAHGGRIIYSSTENGGAHFDLIFPLH